MKQSLWILHSGLLGLCLASTAVLLVSKKPVVRKTSIVPDDIATAKADNKNAVDVHAIYEQDLFGTYVVSKKPLEQIEEERVAALPSMPRTIEVEIPLEKEITFLPPLDISLKGIMYVQDDHALSLAVVQDKNSKDETNYQVGDGIEDGQVLKIYPDKVLLLRSNGQQEMLYIKEAEAIADFAQQNGVALDEVVLPFKSDQYIVNIDLIGHYIANVGSLIYMLDATTVFKQGKGFGCRIGKVNQDTIVSSLGFEVEDIITKVNGHAVGTYKDRIQAYNSVIVLSAGKQMTVEILRAGELKTLTYILKNNATMLDAVEQEAQDHVADGIESNGQSKEVTQQVEEEQDRIQAIQTLDEGEFAQEVSNNNGPTYKRLERAQKEQFKKEHTMALTLDELEAQERFNMKHRGKNKIAQSVKR